MSKILITGATGFAGKWIMQTISDHFGREQVVGTGRNQEQITRLTHRGFQMIAGDLTDPEFVNQKLNSFSKVVHCAARASIWGDYDSFYKANVLATRHLLEGIPSLQQIIYISTPSIYFDFTHRQGIKEDAPLPQTFVNHYATTKYLGEKEVLAWKGGNRIILRPRALLGAGDTVVMPRVLRAQEAGRLKIIGNGDNLADFTAVRNLAQAVLLALKAPPEANGLAFNITDGQSLELWPLLKQTLHKLGYQADLKRIPYPIADTYARLSEWFSRSFSGKEPVLTRYGIGILNYTMTMNIDRARRILGYQPLISTEEAIDEFIEYYQA